MLTEINTGASIAVATAQPGRSAATRHGSMTATHCCLVISAQPERREMLAQAAEEAGWEAMVCSGAQSGWSELQHGDFHLTLLDIQDCNLVEIADLQGLAAAVAARPGSLLVVCGNQNDPREELWARQLGAWLYLPGVEAESDVTMLCDEARVVTERWESCQGVGSR